MTVLLYYGRQNKSKGEPKIVAGTSIWKTVWKLQGELNKLVGIDTLDIGKNASMSVRDSWFSAYCDEASNEAFEAKENFYHKWWVAEVKKDPNKHYKIIDKSKLVLELIDVLHFLVSAMQVKDDFASLEERVPLRAPSCDSAAYKTINSLVVKLINHGYLDALQILKSLFKYLGVDDNAVLKIYQQKHAANVARQKSGYSLVGKTEADNQAIEKSISGSLGKQPDNAQL